MVFESLVVDILNRVLGDFVENLDSKQLKIGIWGGDVVLKNLVLKQSALDELDLPIKTVYGCLGKLVLSIPWKNLYGAPVEATVEDLFLLAVPNQEIKYDPVKEEKYALESKKAELLRIEEAKKKEKEKDLPKADDTFIEKLTMQIIKNVQISIKNIHLRYEDKLTNPGKNFAIGITLRELYVHTTDENWQPAIIQDTVTKIYKILKLEGLSLYWNCDSILFSNLTNEAKLAWFRDSIPSKDSGGSEVGNEYILGPINSSARLKLNPKPDLDEPKYSIPKLLLNVEMEKLAIGISKTQYQDILMLVESMDRMSRGSKYRKYRPFLTSYRGHYKEWWKFAYACILEEEVKRRKQNWDWKHIADHRRSCKNYAQAYQKKLQSKKVNAALEQEVNEYEKTLDVFNIVIIRQRIELEVERLGRAIEEKAKTQTWWGSWFGAAASTEDKELSEKANLLKKFEEAMTPEEKSKLYRAIDYKEKSGPMEYPEWFVGTSCAFLLNELELEVRNNSEAVPRVLSASLKGVNCRIQQRPDADALMVAMKIDNFTVSGVQQEDFIPAIVTSVKDMEGIKNEYLLDVFFETNPLDKSCDQRIKVIAKPLQIVYDAQTVIKIVDVFQSPQSLALDQLQEVANNRIATLKEMSATGLQHSIQKQTQMDLEIDLSAPYILIPHGGMYKGKESVLLINLGTLKMSTVSRDNSLLNVRELYQKGLDEDQILKDVISQSYEKFLIEVTGMQIVIAKEKENWKETMTKDEITMMHLLQPTNLSVTLSRCLVTDDPRLPKLKINGQLPSIGLNITDIRLMYLVALFTSIPFPESNAIPQATAMASRVSSSLSLAHLFEVPDKPKKEPKSSPENIVQSTDLEVNFVIKELTLQLLKRNLPQAPILSKDEIEDDDEISIVSQPEAEKMLELHIMALELEMVQQTFNKDITIRLGGITMNQHRPEDTLELISTPMSSGEDQYLFTLIFSMVDKKSPEFLTKYGMCEQMFAIDFSNLSVLLHQEGLQTLLQFINNLQVRLDEIMNEGKEDRFADAGTAPNLQILETIAENEDVVVKLKKKVKSKKGKKHPHVESILLKIKANIKEVNLKIANNTRDLAYMWVKGLDSCVIMRKSYTQVTVTLQDITINDPNPKSIHKNIMKFLPITDGDEALKAEVVMYNVDEGNRDSVINMSVKAQMGCIRIIFLNWFVSTILDFLDQFQRARQAIIDASAAAAEKTKQNVQSAYNEATGIQLDIKLKAPDIIVPINSQSLNVIMIDLGRLTLQNKFIDIDTNLDRTAVVEELIIQLDNIKVTRAKLDIEYKILQECDLLNPINLLLLMKRNLSSSWYKHLPDLDLSGRLKLIELSISEGDYKMMMEVLNKNLSEGATDKPKSVPVTDSKKTLSRSSSIKKKQAIKKTIAQLETPKEIPKVSTFIKFAFTMDSLIVNLYSGASRIGMTPASSKTNPENGLAKFSMHVLSLKGRILSDSTLYTSILLVDCLLDDTRPGREGKLTRLMERRRDTEQIPSSSKTSEHNVRSMLDITYQQKGSDLFADVRVFSFTTILAVDYLMKIAEFFSKPEEDAPKPKIESKPSRNVQSAQSLTSRIDEEQRIMGGSLTFNLRLEKPDIILVETMDTIDTDAMILNSEITLKYRTAGSNQDISGTIQDFTIFTCIYNPEKRQDTKHSVLQPLSLSIAGATSADDKCKGLQVDMAISDIILSVSPATIELLSRVQGTMYATNMEKELETAKVQDYSNMWVSKNLNETDFWFLKTESAQEIDETYIISEVKPTSEFCKVSAPLIIVTIEAGIGNKTVPMLLLETSFQGTIENWSSQMHIDASLKVQMAYFNSRLAEWEPLIEPVEVIREDKLVRTPWELKMELKVNNEEDSLAMSPSAENADDTVVIPPQQAKQSITISSKENLEMTMTKTCLELLSDLGKAFSVAIKEPRTEKMKIVAPFEVKNDSGLQITLMLQKGSFKIFGDSKDVKSYTEILLDVGASVELQPKVETKQTTNLHWDCDDMVSTDILQQNEENHIRIKINEMDQEIDLPVVKADKRFFSLNRRGDGHDKWGLISDVMMQDGGMILTLRSIIQIHNHFNQPVNVYFMTSRDNEIELICTVEANGSVNLPVQAVYTPTSEIFFGIPGYSISTMPFLWKDLQLTLAMAKFIECRKTNTREKFIMKVMGEIEQVYYEHTNKHTMTSACYHVHLRTAVTFRNCLPIKTVVLIGDTVDEFEVSPGELIHLPHAEPGTSQLVIRIPEYLEKEWSCKREIPMQLVEFAVWSFDSYDSAQKATMCLGIHMSNQHGSIEMSLYCPFWMLNKTGLMLAYRKSRKHDTNDVSGSPLKGDDSMNILYHPEDFKGPILFSFSAKNFFGKKKASIRIEQGEWSDKFSLDVAGSSGIVTCKWNGVVYQIGVSNYLTYNSLTKQVTFTPYYVLINRAPYAIETQEIDRPADTWVKVSPEECMPLWPRGERDEKLLKIKLCDTSEVSSPFLITEVHTTLLKLNNKYGGINVDVQVNEGAVYVIFTAYYPGLAPALIINQSNQSISFWEKESINIRNLDSQLYIYYTWENPAGPRKLVWKSNKKDEIENDLKRDSLGEIDLGSSKTMYWVSFLDGLQRILLFTDDKNLALDAQTAGEFESIDQEITLSIHGMGLSLVNNVIRKEITYIGIASSGVIWETYKENGKRSKPLTIKECELIEVAYQHYLNNRELSPDSGRVTLDAKLEVDFDSMQILRPSIKKLNRTYRTGLWCQQKTSPHQLQIHAKINRLQIDNQLYDCIFPVVFAPVPLPKSVAANNALKPFAELSIVKRIMQHSTVQQYKYFKVLIQEFHIKVDIAFINALMELFEAKEGSEKEKVELFLKNCALVDEPLLAHVSTQSLQEQINYYDMLHFSPLKIHVSFTLQGGTDNASGNIPEFLKVVLQGLGVTLTDLQDVVFKLAYFERTYSFLTQRTLMSEATSHYVGQLVKQFYVLVFGLDVLGNPYGLVLGLSKGVEDLFYEPFQGAIQGPGEFAEGLMLGVKSLFGHTVGGAAGAVSRITGAMGKGLAALTFDKEYQRKRQGQLNKKPANIQEGLARGGKGLVMGVFDGVTGVFVKPISGAKEEGVEGFFKGLGKGALGLVTRPTAGVVDFASGSFDAVKRAAEIHEEITRLRIPRFIKANTLVEPYKKLDAEGNKLLVELEKGKYASTDVYDYHCWIIERRDVLLLTDKRVAYIVRNEIFGGWQIDWSYTWQEITQPPTVTDRGVSISTQEGKKKVLGLFGSHDNYKVILVTDPAMRALIVRRMRKLYVNIV